MLHLFRFGHSFDSEISGSDQSRPKFFISAKKQWLITCPADPPWPPSLVVGHDTLSCPFVHNLFNIWIKLGFNGRQHQFRSTKAQTELKSRLSRGVPFRYKTHVISLRHKIRMVRIRKRLFFVFARVGAMWDSVVVCALHVCVCV